MKPTKTIHKKQTGKRARVVQQPLSIPSLNQQAQDQQAQIDEVQDQTLQEELLQSVQMDDSPTYQRLSALESQITEIIISLRKHGITV